MPTLHFSGSLKDFCVCLTGIPILLFMVGCLWWARMPTLHLLGFECPIYGIVSQFYTCRTLNAYPITPRKIEFHFNQELSLFWSSIFIK